MIRPGCRRAGQSMKKRILSLLTNALLGLVIFGCSAIAAEPKKILVVTTTSCFRHSSIETPEKVLAKLSQQSGPFTLDLAQQPPHQPSAPKKPEQDARRTVREQIQAA